MVEPVNKFDCFNCGPTDRPIKCKGLCTKCYDVDKIREKFDTKKVLKKRDGENFVWDAKRIATLRYFRVGMKFKLPVIAEYLGTTVAQCKAACRKYKIHKHSRGPYTK